jgi:hypothetical protein
MERGVSSPPVLRRPPSRCRPGGLLTPRCVGLANAVEALGDLRARAMGKSLMPDPERAPIVRRVFEQYGTGRFTKQ